MLGFSWQDDRLHADGIAVADLARAAGTPLFVYSAGLLRERLHALRAAFGDLAPVIRYAVKANSNACLMRVVMAEGAGFDLVSGGELLRALRIGADPASLVFAGVGKQDWELKLGLAAGIGMFNVESESELERLGALAEAADKKARIALRLNPDVAVETHEYISTGKKENKFGLDFATADRLVPRIRESARLDLVAYHVHIGSLLLQPEPYLEACRRVVAFLDEDEVRCDGVRYYDLGGGFGSRGGPFRDSTIDLETLAAGLRELLTPRGLRPMLEPGRFLVGDAGLLVTKLLHAKQGIAKEFYVVDAAMNDFIRPALYAAEHDVLPVERGSGERHTVDVVGPVCETADFLACDVELPRLERGALLAITAAGAYGFSMSSNYNSRPLAAEVLTDAGRAAWIRRRQPLDELWAHEVEEALDLSQEAGDPRLPNLAEETWRNA